MDRQLKFDSSKQKPRWRSIGEFLYDLLNAWYQRRKLQEWVNAQEDCDLWTAMPSKEFRKRYGLIRTPFNNSVWAILEKYENEKLKQGNL